eukprot:TRINITY_DN5916_c0_g1_i1.p1 TRINITY_DN5916_c0_g1~~TRINITY_DN5916_c0_g1_i1.p1  ORF type:complete len:229 (-),score=69.68 TRINITY_DN5916_c0_g1_i1:346-963(-)
MAPEPEVRAAGNKSTLYDLLGVKEDVTPDDLKKAYRNQALLRHPDKGGDDDRFDQIAQAYKRLDDPKKRELYDEELAKARDRASLVENIPEHHAETSSGPTGAAASRVKTQATPGSKASMKKQAMVAGYNCIGSPVTVLKALTDGATEEQQAEALLKRYAELPRNKEWKRKWSAKLPGKEKANLKKCAKEHEKAEMEKWQKWLNK